jgi:hypothetical protein
MKKILLLLLVACTVNTAGAQTKRELKKVTELVMPGEEGSNGAAVVWHPVQKKYYAAFAGNAIFPMAVFDSKGKEISDGTLTTDYDLRGMWFNPKTKTIEANCYDTSGWIRYQLNVKGIPGSPVVFLSGMNQPSEQSVGAYNPKNSSMYFLTADGVSVYKLDGTNTSTIALKKTAEEDDMIFDDDNEDYNHSTVIYTGIPKAELGILNMTDKTIDLFNSATGIYTSSWTLPEDVPVNPLFNFAYANGIVWLFDKSSRTWLGYK